MLLKFVMDGLAKNELTTMLTEGGRSLETVYLCIMQGILSEGKAQYN